MVMLQRYFTLLMAALIAGTMLGCARDRPITERVEDQAIETRVKAALLGAPDVAGTSIQVEVLNGDVQLSGFVRTRQEAQRAIEITQRVQGVRKVINKMSVRS